VLETGNEESGLSGVAEEDAGLPPPDLDPDPKPFVDRDGGQGRIAWARVKLPGIDSVEGGQILECVGIQGMPVRPDVEALPILALDDTEENPGIGPETVGGYGDIHLDGPVLELDVGEEGRPQERPPAEELLDPSGRHVPSSGFEIDGLRTGRQRKEDDQTGRPNPCGSAAPESHSHDILL